MEKVSEYSAEAIIFESFCGFSLPAEVVRFSVEHLFEAPLGCYIHGTMTTKIMNPKLWSAEVPFLYTLVLILKDPAGVVIHCEACRVGIRQVRNATKNC
jgi:hypothetical protein